jgi:hypothetical protein
LGRAVGPPLEDAPVPPELDVVPVPELDVVPVPELDVVPAPELDVVLPPELDPLELPPEEELVPAPLDPAPPLEDPVGDPPSPIGAVEFELPHPATHSAATSATRNLFVFIFLPLGLRNRQRLGLRRSEPFEVWSHQRDTRQRSTYRRSTRKYLHKPPCTRLPNLSARART